MHVTFFPKNVKLDFESFCDGCDMSEVVVNSRKTALGGVTQTVYCSHYLACDRAFSHGLKILQEVTRHEESLGTRTE